MFASPSPAFFSEVLDVMSFRPCCYGHLWTVYQRVIRLGLTQLTRADFRVHTTVDDAPKLQDTDSSDLEFELDREKIGAVEQWFDGRLSQLIELSRELTSAGIGDAVNSAMAWAGQIRNKLETLVAYHIDCDLRFSFWLSSKRYFVGVVWYRRTYEAAHLSLKF